MSMRAIRWASSTARALGLPPAERAVLMWLALSHTDRDGCFPSQEYLADETGYRERKVRDLLKSLEGRGVIRRRRERSGGKHARTVYTLFLTPEAGTTGRRGPVDHRQKKAGGDHRQTGAAYRECFREGPQMDGKIIDLAMKTERGPELPEPTRDRVSEKAARGRE